MRRIAVGIRYDLTEGLCSRGIEEVNGLINCGGKVLSIEPGGAILRNSDGGTGNGRRALVGFEITVVVDDAAVASSSNTLEHDRLFQDGSDLISPYMHLVGKTSRPADSRKANEELERGIAILNQAISINPANWPAYWTIGKAYQALGDSEGACAAFGKSFALNKDNADVAREYMFECLNLDRAEKAIMPARLAVSLKPDDAGLAANLALALLIGGQLDEAAEAVAKALEIAPHDDIARNLSQAITDVQNGHRPQPTSMADLDES